MHNYAVMFDKGDGIEEDKDETFCLLEINMKEKLTNQWLYCLLRYAKKNLQMKMI